MTVTCWAPGCRSGYDRRCGERHFFGAPRDGNRLTEWNRRIPREGTLTPKHKLCDLHFEERFIIKSDDFTINGQHVALPRAAWRLTKDAVPTIFPNLPTYLSTKLPRKRNTAGRSRAPSLPKAQKLMTTSCTVEETAHVEQCSTVLVSNCSNRGRRKVRRSDCMHCKSVAARLYQRNKQLRKKNKQIRLLRQHVKKLTAERDSLLDKATAMERMPEKSKQIVSEVLANVDVQSAHGNRYSREWIIDCLLIKCKSHAAYKFLRQHNYLPLPSLATLSRSIRNLQPKFGFDDTLCVALADKLQSFPVAERRGVLMFDEMQISKHIDFRQDLGHNVGFVDMGNCTTVEHRQQEGDHALVFMFRPHMSGWIQTIGCFCCAGATPSAVLCKLILEAIILLEKCGAIVDGIIADGASTNRKALKMLGFCGKKDAVSNKMTNPFDDSRCIYFLCDTPHLLKTVRNNLLKATMFSTEHGMVKLDHYRLLVEYDSSLPAGLRAVPKVFSKHVEPNNFQKMSVSIAAQLFSKSMADGLALYKEHVPGLHDADATIIFTRKMNDIFDLLNARHPSEAVHINCDDKLKKIEEAEQWLDAWERIASTSSGSKLFLSTQTSEGLRVTLRSVRELTACLLQSGFRYVLTGKFNQDSLEMFFGMIRQSCGGDDHPSANQFLYVYRLLSVSNLIKSPPRASIQTEPVTLLADIRSAELSRPVPLLQQLQQRLQLVLTNSGNSDVCGVASVSGQDLADLTFAAAAVGVDCIPDDGLDELMIAADEQRCLADLELASAAAGIDCIPDDGLDELMVAAGETGDLMMTCDMDQMHPVECTDADSAALALTCTSDGRLPEDSVLYYVAGYVAFKLKKFTQCTLCIESLVNRMGTDCDQARLILLRSRGGLQFPSATLLALLSLTEHCLRKNAATLSAHVYRDTIDDVLSSDLQSFLIGCDKHCCSLTSRAVHHYVLTRVHFLNRSRNRARVSRHEKHRLTKISKLT